MPYIPDQERPYYDGVIEEVVNKLVNKLPGDNGREFSAGDLNYVISSITWKLLNKKCNYDNANKLLGVINAVNLEFYRRRVAPYEDNKIEQNGDVNV